MTPWLVIQVTLIKIFDEFIPAYTIFHFPKVSNNWLWHFMNVTKELMMYTFLKTTRFSSFWLPFFFPDMLGTPGTMHILSMHYCYVCMHMAGAA
jgi:hypothetical protein